MGTAYRTDTKFKNVPKTHSKIDTHGVSNYKYLPSIATNVVLSLCCQTTLKLDPNADFGTVKEYTNVSTLSGSSYYLTNKRDNIVMNQTIKYYKTNDKSHNTTLHHKHSTGSTGKNSFLTLPQAQIKHVLTASFIQSMVHNNRFVCQVQLCLLEDHLASAFGNVVFLYLPLFEYTRSRDLFTYLNIDKCNNRNGPQMVGDYVSILMQGTIEPTTNDEIGNDTYNISFVSHSWLLQSHYSELEVCSMRSLFIKLNNAVTQGKMSITDDEQTMEDQILPKHDNIKSNAPIISTTTDPLSEDESVKNDEQEDNNFLCPLYCGGYTNIDYDSSDRHVTKKCKFSDHY